MLWSKSNIEIKISSNFQIQQQQAAESAATTSREPLLIEAAAATTTGLRLAAIQEEQNPPQPTVGAADIQRLFEAGRNVSWIFLYHFPVQLAIE